MPSYTTRKTKTGTVVDVRFRIWGEETFDIPNLYKSVRKPNRKEMKSEMKIWELKEFLRFQETVDDVLWKTFFMCLFYSGRRVGEAVALSDADVYRVNGVYCLDINKNLSRKTMRTDDKFVISAPKTATSNRAVALPQVMNAQIDQYLAYKTAHEIPGKSAGFLRRRRAEEERSEVEIPRLRSE